MFILCFILCFTTCPVYGASLIANCVTFCPFFAAHLNFRNPTIETFLCSICHTTSSHYYCRDGECQGAFVCFYFLMCDYCVYTVNTNCFAIVLRCFDSGALYCRPCYVGIHTHENDAWHTPDTVKTIHWGESNLDSRNPNKRKSR